MVRIITWNIGGAHTVRSGDLFDYGKEELSYFADRIRALDPDIVCIQESHTNEADVLAKRLADSLGLAHVFNEPRSPSHIDERYQLSNTILSKFPMENRRHIRLPDPSFELYFRNGQKARLFHTYVQIASISGVTIANTHFQPLHLFGYEYGKEPGGVFAREVERALLDVLETPLIFCGDFNAPHLLADFPMLIDTLKLHSALPDQPTDMNGNQMDYILYSSEITLKSSGVVCMDHADHHMGWVEVGIDERLCKSKTPPLRIR